MNELGIKYGKRWDIVVKALTLSLKILFLLLLCLVISGCLNDREGKLVTRWIACKKSETRKWVSADKSLIVNRLDLVYKSEYQVSFASQRVVSSTGLELKKCTVYDRNNWTCEDFDGSLLIAKDGNMPLPTCGKTTNTCFPKVNLYNRADILLNGVNAVDRICGSWSEAFETILKFKR